MQRPNFDPTAQVTPTREDLFPNGINVYDYMHLYRDGESWDDLINRVVRQAQTHYAGRNYNTNPDGSLNTDSGLGVGIPGSRPPARPSSGGLQITQGVNPFAAAARRVGYTDFQETGDAMSAQKNQAQALRAGG